MITFEVISNVQIGEEYGWARVDEAFCRCRRCGRCTIFVTQQTIEIGADFFSLDIGIDRHIKILGIIAPKDLHAREVPKFVPADIEVAYKEAATCLSVGCYSASSAMSRKCLDLATKSLLPETEEPGLNRQVRFSLGHRLEWLFNSKRLPDELRELAECIKEDGNDGAHSAPPLTKIDAEDVLDFADAVLERIYTEPGRLLEAKERRAKRRSPESDQS